MLHPAGTRLRQETHRGKTQYAVVVGSVCWPSICGWVSIAIDEQTGKEFEVWSGSWKVEAEDAQL